MIRARAPWTQILLMSTDMPVKLFTVCKRFIAGRTKVRERNNANVL
jgi:hypothetical protein